jgi:hypothetical protein
LGQTVGPLPSPESRVLRSSAPFEPRHNDPEVQEAAEADFVRQIVADIVRERRLVREDAGELKKDPGHPDPGISEDGSECTKPAERKVRCRHQCVRVENPAEHDVHEEAFGGVLGLGQVDVVEVAGDDARVVCSVPGRGGPDGNLPVVRGRAR